MGIKHPNGSSERPHLEPSVDVLSLNWISSKFLFGNFLQSKSYFTVTLYNWYYSVFTQLDSLLFSSGLDLNDIGWFPKSNSILKVKLYWKKKCDAGPEGNIKRGTPKMLWFTATNVIVRLSAWLIATDGNLCQLAKDGSQLLRIKPHLPARPGCGVS